MFKPNEDSEVATRYHFNHRNSVRYHLFTSVPQVHSSVDNQVLFVGFYRHHPLPLLPNIGLPH
jgi:hypothetical protein